jgi:hypothetical protein
MPAKSHGKKRFPARPRRRASRRLAGQKGVIAMEPEFLFDFGSPNAYLSHQAIPAI